MSEQKPWEVHPDLSEDRLKLLASITRRIRHDALEEHQPERGDTNWGLGCRVHERTCFTIKVAAESGNYPWLKVLDPSLHFVFQIGRVPVRFYHGDAERQNLRSAQRRYPELQAQQAAFDFKADYELADWRWRIVVETHPDGTVMREVMVQLDERGNPRNPWPIPEDGTVTTLAAVIPIKKEGVDLPPPEVKPKPGEQAEAANPDDGD